MTATATVLIAQADMPNATTLAYTSPVAGKGSRIDYFVATNHSGATKSINVYVVPFGGTAGTANIVLQAVSLVAGESRVLFELLGRRMAPGDFISGDASAATSVSWCATGVELTG